MNIIKFIPFYARCLGLLRTRSASATWCKIVQIWHVILFFWSLNLTRDVMNISRLTDICLHKSGPTTCSLKITKEFRTRARKKTRHLHLAGELRWVEKFHSTQPEWRPGAMTDLCAFPPWTWVAISGQSKHKPSPPHLFSSHFHRYTSRRWNPR